MPTPVIAIFDIGKTNKKLFLFNEAYQIVHEETVQLKETVDEDGEVCEDLTLLTEWVKGAFAAIMSNTAFDVKAVNFSAYGASFVHIMKPGKQLLPLYNYLKTYPQNLQQQFYATYGGEKKIARETASPVSGSLNSGLQLYRLKKLQPIKFNEIEISLHLPQYLSFLITGIKCSDMTGIGCHTSLWNFETNAYHTWVYSEGIHEKLAPVKNGDAALTINYNNQTLKAGVGLHDSSAALIPYLINFTEPFVLISTGTWCISLNPFNNTPLTSEELNNECLCYIQYKGLPVKASRLFAGYGHEQQIQKMAVHFAKPVDYYKQVAYNASLANHLNTTANETLYDEAFFIDLHQFKSYEEAYHQLMANIVAKQFASTQIIIKGTAVKRILLMVALAIIIFT